MELQRTNELRATIAALGAEGLAADVIAARAGCARSTVYKVLRAPGPDLRAVGRESTNRIDPRVAAEIVALAAADVGRSASTIRDILTTEAGMGGGEAPVPSTRTIGRVLREVRRCDIATDGRDDVGDEKGATSGEVSAPADRGVRGRPRPAPRAPREGKLAGIVGGDGALTATDGMAGTGLYATAGWEDYAAAREVDPACLDAEIALVRAMLRRNARELATARLGTRERTRAERHVSSLVEVLTAAVRARPSGAKGAAGVLELLKRLGNEAG